MLELTKAERGLLERLGRPGRFLQCAQTEAGDSRWQIVQTKDDCCMPGRNAIAATGNAVQVRAPLAEIARRRGWLEPVEGNDHHSCFRLTRRARALLADQFRSYDLQGAKATMAHSAPSNATPEAQSRSKCAPSKSGGAHLLSGDLASPLAWLRRRKDSNGRPLISDTELMAAERFRQDFERMHAHGPTTAAWSRLAGDGAQGSQTLRAHAFADQLDRRLGARQRCERALERLGPELASVVIDACCHGVAITNLEDRYGWPKRAGKVVLRIALKSLSHHYGYTTAPPDEAQR